MNTQAPAKISKLSSIRFVAPAVHAILFLSTWTLYFVSNQPMMDGLSGLPFDILMLVDIPISFVAFGILFTSTTYGPAATIAWGVIGTFWWYLLGRSIEAWVARFRKKRNAGVDVPQSEVRGNWGAWVIGGSLLLFLVMIGTAWKQNRADELSHEPGKVFDLALAPDGQSAVFVRSIKGTDFLYRMATSGGPARRLSTATTGKEDSPSFSPDGKLIVYSYTVNEGQPSRVYVVNSDGSNPRPLFPFDEKIDDIFPRFSSDGSVYFARGSKLPNLSAASRPDSREWDIYSSDVSGTEIRRVTQHRFRDIGVPSVTADGKKVLFCDSYTENGSRLRVYTTDSSAPMVLVHPRIPNQSRTPIYNDAQFTPDGRVVFMAASNGKKAFDYDVYRLDLATNEIEKLTTENGYATDLRVSADGKKAIFQRWTSKSGNLPTVSQAYVLDLETKQVTPLSITGGF